MVPTLYVKWLFYRLFHQSYPQKCICSIGCHIELEIEYVLILHSDSNQQSLVPKFLQTKHISIKLIFFLLLFQDDGIEFFNTIVLQPHLKLVTDLGRGYHVRCRYKSREAVAKLTKSAESSPQAYRSEEVNDRGEHGRALGSR